MILLTCVQGKDERDTREETAEERLRRRAYERGCQRLKKRIEGMSRSLTQHQICSPVYQCNSESVCLVVEELQVQILRLMLNNKDKGTVRWCVFCTRLVLCEEMSFGGLHERLYWKITQNSAISNMFQTIKLFLCLVFLGQTDLSFHRAKHLDTSSWTSSASSFKRTPVIEG